MRFLKLIGGATLALLLMAGALCMGGCSATNSRQVQMRPMRATAYNAQGQAYQTLVEVEEPYELLAINWNVGPLNVKGAASWIGGPIGVPSPFAANAAGTCAPVQAAPLCAPSAAASTDCSYTLPQTFTTYRTETYYEQVPRTRTVPQTEIRQVPARLVPCDPPAVQSDPCAPPAPPLLEPQYGPPGGSACLPECVGGCCEVPAVVVACATKGR